MVPAGVSHVSPERLHPDTVRHTHTHIYTHTHTHTQTHTYTHTHTQTHTHTHTQADPYTAALAVCCVSPGLVWALCYSMACVEVSRQPIGFTSG